ncbi:RNB domain-containing ribonuclease [Propioniciclava coleopterorum]|uniref:RNB domain-containing ribonuclease n=1 Tax=Propioniciclava coleopterorum TaxID=2714937 RepID=UPI001FE545C3|nr:RNB domain-containing ribonuclease [Propioniciclava coleopterorum]
MAAYLRSKDAPEPIRPGLARLRGELDVPVDFPADVLAEAQAAADGVRPPERDATDIPLVTIDPPGSTDLDQALFIERSGDGYRVVYAIADLERFVAPGGAIDAEAHARGVTLYAPDGRTPLHPPVLSEGAASLLPDQERPALLWEHTLDASGATVASTVAPARVRSRAQLTYEQVQAALDGGTADDSLQLLREVGRKREELERARGGVSLQIPSRRSRSSTGSGRSSSAPRCPWRAGTPRSR